MSEIVTQCSRDCLSCKHEKELHKPPQERDLNCQQCAVADRITGISHPNWEKK